MCSINFFYFNYLIKNKKKNQNKSNIKNKKKIFFFTRNSRLKIKKNNFRPDNEPNMPRPKKNQAYEFGPGRMHGSNLFIFF